MRNFDEFVKKGIVKKRRKDSARAKSLIDEAEKRLKFYKAIPLKDDSANYIIENMYDVIRELIEAKLLLEGYKSYSHEAKVSYLKNLNFTISEVKFLDDLRMIRNKTKYYGHRINEEYAKRVLDFVDKIYSRLKKAASS